MKYDNILFFATIFEATAIHKKFSDKPINFVMSCGANANKGEGDAETNRTLELDPYTHDRCTWYLEIEREKPCLNVCTSWLDFRRRMYNANMLEKISIDMVKRQFAFHSISIGIDFVLLEKGAGQN